MARPMMWCELSERKMRKALGQHVVVDTAVCHGRPTFRGTRIFVSDVLEQVASGMAWEAIVEEWRGAVTLDAIAEAVRLARDAFLSHEYHPAKAG